MTSKDQAEKAIQTVKHWLDNNLLSLNVNKTKFVNFALSPRSLPEFKNLKVHNHYCDLNQNCICNYLIKKVTFIKYLGVLIDQNFTWKEHISYVTTKIRKLIYKFYELRHVLSLSTLKMVYYALVETVLSCGWVVWGSATILKKLQVAQKYIIKIMLFKNKRFSTEFLFKESQVLDS